MKTINELNEEIRSFINTPDIHSLISLDEVGFNQVCSCLDLIDDTEQALDAYIGLHYPAAMGERYLVLYGVLHAIRLQQDAVKNLFESLGVEYDQDEELNRIRETVDSAIINTTKKEINNVRCSCGVTQPTLSHEQFTLWILAAGAGFKHEHVRVLERIQTQRGTLAAALSGLLRDLHGQNG
jgi:hypothetical protein